LLTNTLAKSSVPALRRRVAMGMRRLNHFDLGFSPSKV
jgi:hypothetical protein